MNPYGPRIIDARLKFFENSVADSLAPRDVFYEAFKLGWEACEKESYNKQMQDTMAEKRVSNAIHRLELSNTTPYPSEAMKEKRMEHAVALIIRMWDELLKRGMVY